MRDKIYNPLANFVVGKYSTGVLLSEWVNMTEARAHSKVVEGYWQGESCPYAVYTREEWEGKR